MTEFRNRTFAEIEIGATATIPHRLTRMDLDALALVSGEVDPFHLKSDELPTKEFAAEAVAAEALLTAMLKRRLPGPGTTIVSQDLRFAGNLSAGDEVKGTVTAIDKHEEENLIVFKCRISRGEEDVIWGTVTVSAPIKHISYSHLATPQVILRR